MSKPGYWELAVKCPFYKRTEKKKQRIICDGISPHTRMTLVFFQTTDEERVRHLKTFCCDRFDKCPLYHAAGERFEN